MDPPSSLRASTNRSSSKMFPGECAQPAYPFANLQPCRSVQRDLSAERIQDGPHILLDLCRVYAHDAIAVLSQPLPLVRARLLRLFRLACRDELDRAAQRK